MKRLFKHMSIYGLGGILGKLASFLLLPLYTRVLAPDDYGVLTLVSTISGIIGILYGFMISSGFARNYYDSADQSRRNILFNSALWFVFLNAFIFSAILFLFSNQIAPAIFRFENGALYLKLGAISTFLTSLSVLFLKLLVVREQSQKYVAVSIISLIASISLNILFVVVLRWSVTGVLIGGILGGVIELVILSLLLVRGNVFAVSLAAIKDMLRFSIPLIPAEIASLILLVSDRFFLQKYANVSAVGIYSLGYKFAAVLPILFITPLKSWQPYIFSLIDDQAKCKKTIADFSRYYWAGVLFLALLISIFSREVLFVMATKGFLPAWKVVYVLSLSYVFLGMMNVICYGFHIVKLTWVACIVDVAGAILNLMLNYLLIPRYGMIGASIATAVAYLVILIGYFMFLEKFYPISFAYFKFIGAFILTTLIYVISLFINLSILPSIFIKCIIMILFVFSLFIAKYFNKSDQKIIKEAFKRVRIRISSFFSDLAFMQRGI